MILSDAALARAVRQAVRPLSGALDDYDPLLERIGACRLKGGAVKAREIAAGDWPAFFRVFTHLHRGQPATVSMWDPSLRAEARTGELPLDSVAAGRSSAPEISIHIGTGSRRHLEFGVEKPARVWLERTDSGGEDLEIEAASGARTLVACRAATH